MLSEWLWKTKRPRLTVLQTEEPALLDLKQVTDVLGTELEQFMNTVKHAKKRTTSAQAWATAMESTTTPDLWAVLEAVWKWDGVGGQPDRGLDGPDFEALFLTYRACYTDHGSRHTGDMGGAPPGTPDVERPDPTGQGRYAVGVHTGSVRADSRFSQAPLGPIPQDG